MANLNPFFNKGLTYLFNQAGLLNQVNIISYTINAGSYDDDTVQTLTGSRVISGLIFPVESVPGSQEALLLERGELLTKDKVLYAGSFSTSGNLLFEVGSKTGDWYTIIPDGIQTYEVNGSIVFNKIFLRHTIPGSLF